MFSGGDKLVKFSFNPSKLKKQPFLLIISKSRGGQAPPPCSPLSDAHARNLAELLVIGQEPHETGKRAASGSRAAV